MTKQPEYLYVYIKSFRTSLIQKDTLDKLKNKYYIDISRFIRDAIKEKIKRDYSFLVEQIIKDDCPF